MKETFNFYGTQILCLREIKRFLKVYHQTIVAPAISSMLFWTVFVLALGDANRHIHGIIFGEFMGCGLIIMSMIQNSFANSASSLIMSKVIGYVTDILMPPFTGLELTIAYLIGAVVRGLAVGILVLLCLSCVINFSIYNYWLLIFFSLNSCILMGLCGIFVGIIANNFDQSSAITNYVIVPLSFLSGTFYTIEKLPIFLQCISYFNPFFYMIDGFRYSLTGYTNTNMITAISVLLVINISLFTLSIIVFNRGWRLKL